MNHVHKVWGIDVPAVSELLECLCVSGIVFNRCQWRPLTERRGLCFFVVVMSVKGIARDSPIWSLQGICCLGLQLDVINLTLQYFHYKSFPLYFLIMLFPLLCCGFTLIHPGFSFDHTSLFFTLLTYFEDLNRAAVSVSPRVSICCFCFARVSFLGPIKLTCFYLAEVKALGKL